MTEPGSDRQFVKLADASAINRQARAAALRRAVEEWRTAHAPEADDEPGTQYPDPDEAPPADEPHPEFDPTPEVNQ